MTLRIPAWALLAGAEARLLVRSPLTVTLAVALPVAVGLLIVWGEGDTGRAGWGAAAGLLLVMLMALTAYTAGTTTLASRRQQCVLRRLRHSGASDVAIMAGVLAPTAVLTVVQAAAMFGVIAAAAGSPPDRPVPILVATGAGIAAACVLAIATAAVTPAPELAQLTTCPIALAFAGGGFWIVRSPAADVSWPMLTMPGGAVVQLVRFGWEEPDAARPAVAIVSLLILIMLATPLAVRAFRWDSRR